MISKRRVKMKLFGVAGALNLFIVIETPAQAKYIFPDYDSFLFPPVSVYSYTGS